jgi:hypothetical protein
MKRERMMIRIGYVLACLTAATRITATAEEGGAARIRIGTYDSRSVAVAFAGSAPFNEWMAGLKTDHEKAKAAGDTERVAALEKEAQARQRLMHQQGFSTAPVEDILATIKDKLPAIRAKAGVEALVSKWDKAGLAKYRDAEQADVTMALIEAFNPSERQRKSAIDIQKHKPISLEQARNIDD